MTPHHTPSLPSGEVGEMIALLIRDADLLDSVNGRPITFESTEFPQRLRQAAAALTASEAARESERDARHKLENALRSKDAAMQVLFDRLTAAGVDYSDLIP